MCEWYKTSRVSLWIAVQCYLFKASQLMRGNLGSVRLGISASTFDDAAPGHLAILEISPHMTQLLFTLPL